MNNKLLALYERLKEEGRLSADSEAAIRRELELAAGNPVSPAPARQGGLGAVARAIYGPNDLGLLQAFSPPEFSSVVAMRSLDEILERDVQREKDGFPRKIRVGRIVKPGKGGKDKVVIVPSTVEEKLYHDTNFLPPEDGETMGGSGDGDEGEVIGEQQVREEESGDGTGPGQGEGAGHEVESNAYDLGRILTEQFHLPNLKDKGKKRSLTKYNYDLTDRNRGFGQILDKKATLRRIVETNIHLGLLGDPYAIDPTKFLISPKDKVYRILSKEKDFESQALIFFVRDYSGSMGGPPTETVVSQHVLIYSWLLFQYDRQVETRFILHDTEAKEVPDFYTYYNSRVAGGTQVSAAYKFVNEIVLSGNLAQDYNIYIFHGTDGDDWDTDGKDALPELEKMLTYANRVGVTIAENGFGKSGNSEVEKYLKKSKILEKHANLIRLDVMQRDADEKRIIEGIRKLIS